MIIPFYRKILPTLLALITGSERYLPSVDWSDKSWVHNLFRVYEIIFWRKRGLRVEVIAGAWGEMGISFEGKCAVFESKVRRFLKRLSFVPVYLPVPALIGGRSIRFPFLFAIGVDATADGGAAGATTDTWAHTVGGTDRGLMVMSGSREQTAGKSATYNSDSMTYVIGSRSVDNTSDFCSVFKLIAPDTGANNVVVNEGAADTIGGGSVSFSGADQVTLVGASDRATTTTSALSYTLTTTRAGSYSVESQWIQSAEAVTQDQSQTEIGDAAVGTRQRACSYLAHTTAGGKTLGFSSASNNVKDAAFAEVMEGIVSAATSRRHIFRR